MDEYIKKQLKDLEKTMQLLGWFLSQREDFGDSEFSWVRSLSYEYMYHLCVGYSFADVECKRSLEKLVESWEK
jgi:hypothetical protein